MKVSSCLLDQEVLKFYINSSTTKYPITKLTNPTRNLKGIKIISRDNKEVETKLNQSQNKYQA